MAEGTNAAARLARLVGAPLVITAVAGCGSTQTSTPARKVGAPAPSATAPATGGCHARGSGLEVLPDAHCTPGATNPQVTQANISTTICRRGWAASVRPPESVTEPLKRASMTAYDDTGPISSYEDDHLVALSSGGSPADPRNQWAEPGATPNPKDAVEVAANRAICTGRLTLDQAQTAMATDWITLGRQLGAGT